MTDGQIDTGRQQRTLLRIELHVKNFIYGIFICLPFDCSIKTILQQGTSKIGNNTFNEDNRKSQSSKNYLLVMVYYGSLHQYTA